MTLLKIVKRIWIRLNVIIAYPLLLFMDIMRHIFDKEDYDELRTDSYIILKKYWFKH